MNSSKSWASVTLGAKSPTKIEYSLPGVVEIEAQFNFKNLFTALGTGRPFFNKALEAFRWEGNSTKQKPEFVVVVPALRINLTRMFCSPKELQMLLILDSSQLGSKSPMYNWLGLARGDSGGDCERIGC